jgi:hypothetical protein
MSDSSTTSAEQIEQVRRLLSTTPARWIELAGSLSTDRLTQPPVIGQWSALECLLHLVDTERVFQFRLNAFLTGQPEFPPFDPDREGARLGSEQSAAALAAEFSRLRQTSLSELERITPADFDHLSRHQELGMVSLGEMINEWAAHDLNHTVQAERSLMQPFLRACGPWLKYFTDHVAAEEQP